MRRVVHGGMQVQFDQDTRADVFLVKADHLSNRFVPQADEIALMHITTMQYGMVGDLASKMRCSERLRPYEKLGQEEILVSRHLIAFAIYDISSRCVLYVSRKVDHHGFGRSVKPFCHKTAKELLHKFHCLRQVKQMMEFWLGRVGGQQIEELCMHPEQSS